jgi:hypothetical protein
VQESQYTLVAKDDRNHAWINALDWSADGTQIRTSAGDYEVLYYDV